MKAIELINTINAGYKIVRAQQYQEDSFIVMGKNEKREAYVTWEAGIERDSKKLSYFWGHYFEEENPATRDYAERIITRYQVILDEYERLAKKCEKE